MQIKDLKAKEDTTLTVMIKSVQSLRTAAQKPYLKFEFVDKSGSIFANKWSVKPSELEAFSAGQIVTVKGLVQLYNAQKQKLYFIAYKMLNDEKLAEEAVSEAFLNISVKFDSFKTLSDSQIEAYCVLTLKNICKNIINSESKNNCISIDDCENDDSFLSDIEL